MVVTARSLVGTEDSPALFVVLQDFSKLMSFPDMHMSCTYSGVESCAATVAWESDRELSLRGYIDSSVAWIFCWSSSRGATIEYTAFCPLEKRATRTIRRSHLHVLDSELIAITKTS